MFDASVAVIIGNSQADDDFRFYINKNNTIIKALNEIYGGVSAKYAAEINEAGNKLATNLLNSLTSLSDRERKSLMDELGLNTPSPSPTVKPTGTPAPSPSEAPSHSPAPAQAVPTPTPRPANNSSNSNQSSSGSNNSSADNEPILSYDLD